MCAHWSKSSHRSTSFPVYAYGAIPSRRREEAIAIQQVTGWRLRAKGYSSCLKSYDTTNAFPSPTAAA
eukprot:949932-Alexandrium_andersonii.AAC.1